MSKGLELGGREMRKKEESKPVTSMTSSSSARVLCGAAVPKLTIDPG